MIAVSEDKLHALEDMKRQLRMVLQGDTVRILHGRRSTIWWMKFSVNTKQSKDQEDRHGK